MLHAIALFGTLCVVETIQRTYQISRDAANALEADFGIFLVTAALRALIVDDTVITNRGLKYSNDS